MKSKSIIHLLLILLILSACSSEDDDITTVDLIKQIRVIDLGNNEGANDLLVLFKMEDAAMASSVRVFIVESALYNDVNPNDFKNIEDAKTQSVLLNPNASSFEVTLRSSLEELNGNPIINGNSYNIGFVIEIDGKFRLNSQSGIVALSEEHYLNGDYTGTWTDNLYTDFGVSAKLEMNGSTLAGTFFYSSNFLSCCGGIHDGNVSFRVVDGEVQNFKYSQVLANFMGGECTGTYTGQGIQEDYTSFAISFEGNDCEGPHTGGRIVLNKL